MVIECFHPLTLLFYVPNLCFICGPMAPLFQVIMKATVFLTYADDSEVCFEFNCDESKSDALALLMMCVRGTLMASMATKICAYDEDGFEIVSYYK